MAEALKDRLRADLNAARRDRDKLRTTVLTTTLSEVRNYEIDKGRDAADEDVIQVLTRAIKQRKESADQARAVGRPDVADREAHEAELLQAYMPEQMDEDEVRALIEEAIGAGANNIGAVMGRIMPKLKGRFDGKEANRLAREALGGGDAGGHAGAGGGGGG
ncbi:MAG: GatB/YqeY domain-containing protein [Gemmatimonadota bacterium]